MVWYYVLIAVAVPIAIRLLIPYIRKRYIDRPTVQCPACGNMYQGKMCQRCGMGWT